jgi:hypothetical protein
MHARAAAVPKVLPPLASMVASDRKWMRNELMELGLDSNGAIQEIRGRLQNARASIAIRAIAIRASAIAMGPSKKNKATRMRSLKRGSTSAPSRDALFVPPAARHKAAEPPATALRKELQQQGGNVGQAITLSDSDEDIEEAAGETVDESGPATVLLRGPRIVSASPAAAVAVARSPDDDDDDDDDDCVVARVVTAEDRAVAAREEQVDLVGLSPARAAAPAAPAKGTTSEPAARPAEAEHSLARFINAPTRDLHRGGLGGKTSQDRRLPVTCRDHGHPSPGR